MYELNIRCKMHPEQRLSHPICYVCVELDLDNSYCKTHKIIYPIDEFCDSCYEHQLLISVEGEQFCARHREEYWQTCTLCDLDNFLALEDKHTMRELLSEIAKFQGIDMDSDVKEENLHRAGVLSNTIQSERDRLYPHRTPTDKDGDEMLSQLKKQLKKVRT